MLPCVVGRDFDASLGFKFERYYMKSCPDGRGLNITRSDLDFCARMTVAITPIFDPFGGTLSEMFSSFWWLLFLVVTRIGVVFCNIPRHGSG
jgi:hypothetical protein